VVKRCLIVAFYFPPNGGGGVQRITKLIKYLSLKGWQFTVITADKANPNLHSDFSLLSEIPKNVHVEYIPFSSSNNKVKLSKYFKSNCLVRYINSFIFIPDRYLKWIYLAKDRAQKMLLEKNHDLILISSPPYSLSILANEMTKLVNIPVVLDMRDPWTTNPYKIHPSNWHLKKDYQIEMDTIFNIKYGVSAYQSLIDFYSQNIPDFQKKNWKCISNGYDEEDFENLSPVPLQDSQFHLAFSGTFYSHLNHPKILFEAINMLEPSLKEKLVFHHIGSTVINLEKIAAEAGISSNLKLWGYKTHKECLNILSSMDAFCFILDETVKNATNTIGGKVYEYLKLNKPILSIVPVNGEAAKLINATNSGKVVRRDKKEISTILEKWIKERPKNLKLESQQFSRKKLANDYENHFNSIINDAKLR